jgi:hypothetical protein
MSTVKSPFDLARKYLEPMPEQLATDGRIIAVKICSCFGRLHLVQLRSGFQA